MILRTFTRVALAAILMLSVGVVANAANIIFMSDCGDSTGDFSEFSGTTSSNASVQTSISKTGTAAVLTAYPNSSASAFFQAGSLVGTHPLANAGTRISVYVRFSALPAAQITLLQLGSGTNKVLLSTAGNLVLSVSLTPITATGGTTLLANTWYRITFSYTVTSSSVNEFRVFLDNASSPECSLSNAAAVDTSADNANLVLGSSSNVTANTNVYYDNIYIDNGTTLDNPSTNGLFVTRKAPAASGTNNAFDTAIGSATNRWDYVSELPISTGKGWKQAGSSQVIEAYGIQSASQGDVDITGATILGWKAWLSGAGQDVTTGAPKTTATNSAKASGTTLALGPITVAAGDMVVVAFGDQVGGSAPTISDNIGGNTWTALTTSTNTIRTSKWRSALTNGGSMTITITFGSSSASRAGVVGAWDSSYVGAFDANPANANDSTSPYDCPLSGTLGQSDEIVLGFAFKADNADFAAGASDTLVDKAHSTGGSGSTNCAVAMTYRKVTATTSIQPQLTGANATGVVGTASFKITPISAGTPKLVDNGVDVAITLTSAQTFYSNVDTSSSYPSNGNTVGMKSTGNAMDTFLYETGIQIAYIPATVTPSRIPRLMTHRIGER